MKNLPNIKFLVARLVSLAMFASLAQGADAAESASSTDKSAILSTLHTYEAALNKSDVEGMASAYADDGVVMPPSQPSAVGKTAIHQFYAEGSKIIALNLKFDVAEVVEVAPEWAFVRTSSTGTIKILATGAVVPESNKELFIFKKDTAGDWKIARYSFSVNSKH